MEWTVETVSAVDAEMAALPVSLRARLLRLLETVEMSGWMLFAHRMSGISKENSGSFGFGAKAGLRGGFT